MHIIGAGGHAKVVLDILLESNQHISGIWDENSNLKFLLGYTIYGDFKAFKQLSSEQFVIAIGNNFIRKQMASQLGSNKARVIHPRSVISKFAKIGIGTVVMANVTVNADTLIGDYVILNTNASVDHECKLADFVHISPHVALGGNVSIGEGTHIGIGSSVIQGINIGKWATVGAGAVIIRDIPDYAVVVGNPGRIIKYNKI
uniref:acetyltransferase n=1 Tax=Pedobacter schmidteae TaxID=2201271 RepID=UPI000EB52D40|nr:acetyltransferase [Pedobacter schmidteae]